MPPKARISRDMVVEAALAVARRDGAERVNARTVARELNCSTQPVMYHFDTIEALRRAVYARADRLHTEYLLTVSPEEDPLLGIGLNYIRFALREPHLFRFLFQSGCTDTRDVRELIESPALLPILSALGGEAGTDPERTKEIFWTVALFVHGYASLLSNNPMDFDETLAAAHLERTFRGAVLAAGEETP